MPDTASTRTLDTPLVILHLEDALPDHQLAARALEQAGLTAQLHRVETLAELERTLASQRFDLVLADYHLAGFTALEAFSCARKAAHNLPFVLLSGAIGEAIAVAAIQQGMSDYLAKDDVHKLGPVVLRALEAHATHQAKNQADADLGLSRQRLAEFALHLQNTVEQERAAIAREIHDEIGGSLAAIQFDLAWLGRKHADPASQNHVQNATGMLKQAMVASQAIMMNLRPAVLDQGLAAALEWLAKGFEKRTGISVQMQLALGAQELGQTLELTAYRCAQEALTNVQKYANSSQVTLECSDSQGTLTLEVRDNGIGLAEGVLQKSRSFGLRGLQERAKLSGGWLDIGSRTDGPNRGTAIVLSIPLNAETANREHEEKKLGEAKQGNKDHGELAT